MRPRTKPAKSATEYEFNRNEVRYSCIARPSEVREDELTWIATVESVQFECFLYSGEEFVSRNDRAAFENDIIDAVLVRTHEQNIPSETDGQVLRMSELRPGRLLEHRDGREGRAVEVDPVRQRVLFEIRAAEPSMEWTDVANVQLSRNNALFVRPRGFQVK